MSGGKQRGPKWQVGAHRLKGLRRVHQDGRYYVYHRASGARMPDLPENHPDFLAAFLNAERGQARPRKRRAREGSLLDVWHAYCISDLHRALSASYRRDLEREGDQIIRGANDVLLRDIRQDHIEADLRDLAPHKANRRRKAWRAMMIFACGRGLIDADPSKYVDRRKAAKAEPYAAWSPGEVDAFRARWPLPTMQRVAFELLHWTGARISDTIRFGPGMVDKDGWLVYRQQKTGGEVAIPFRRTVPAFADPADLDMVHAAIGQHARQMTFVTTEYGTSRSPKSASQWFSKTARAAGISAKTAHGLRGTRCVLHAEGGATTHQLGAWVGHESLKEIEHYTKDADKRRVLSGPEAAPKIVQKI